MMIKKITSYPPVLPNMALANFLLLLLSLSCSSYGVTSYPSIQSMVTQACTDVEDRNSCLTNVQAELQKMGPQTQDSVSILTAALSHTLKETKSAIQIITKFNSLPIRNRESVAIEDCKELLDYTVSELAWSLDEMIKIRGGDTNVHYEGNLKAWLSAALSNQDTCLEGFEGTNRRLQNFVRGSLKQVTQLIDNVLALYTQLHSSPAKPPRGHGPPTNKSSPGDNFPAWMSEEDQELVKSNPKSAVNHAVVAADGSGQYRTITEAVNEAPNYNLSRFVIYVKKGIYRENIDLKKNKTNIMFVGDGIGQTIVTGNRNFMQGWTTFRSATVAVSGNGFIARDMTIRNTAGPWNHQAVALRVDSDQSAFFRCSVEGYQDTLYAHSLRQFYRECTIYGTVDFIFGNGAAVLQNCKIYTRVPLPQQKITVTAHGRKNPHQSTGFAIQDSFVLATQPTYLGRPWKKYSRTVYINTYMSGLVQPRGWLEWYGDFALGTLWYGEYRNYGPGAAMSGRVKWPGYHVLRDAAAASVFTVGRFIDGMAWLPSTGVKFTAGLSN